MKFFRDRWFSIDLRTLGLFRIAFGLCLIGNLYDHAAGGNLTAFFSNDGVLSNHFALFAPIQPRPWSLLFAFSRPAEVGVGFAGIFLVYLLYTVGWKTRLMQVLVIVCFVSIVNRNLLLQDGGSFTCTLLAVWTAFLPLGARFSVDRWLSGHSIAGPSNISPAAVVSPSSWLLVPPPMAPGPAPLAASLDETRGDSASLASRVTARQPTASGPAHVSFVCFALLVQLAVIYGFNAAHKTGSTWRDGTAIHYVLWQLSRNTALAGWLRLHEPPWFSPLLTRATIVFEWAAAFLALSPFFQTVCRRVLIIGMWMLHLGIASLMSLGAFSYAMLAFSLLLLRREDWDRIEASPALRAMRAEVARLLGRLMDGLPVRLLAFIYHQRARITARNTLAARHEPFPGVMAAYVVHAPGRRAAARGRMGWGGHQTTRRWRATAIVRELAALLLFVTLYSELTIANAAVPPAWRWDSRPTVLTEVLAYLRLYETWGMFAPDVPTSDGGVVVEAILADGTKLDPLTGRPPDFETPLHGRSYGLDHDWSEYWFYYPWERHAQFRPGLREYIVARYQAHNSAPEKEIRSLDIYWVKADCPPPGERQPRNVQRELMTSFVAPNP